MTLDEFYTEFRKVAKDFKVIDIPGYWDAAIRIENPAFLANSVCPVCAVANAVRPAGEAGSGLTCAYWLAAAKLGMDLRLAQDIADASDRDNNSIRAKLLSIIEEESNAQVR